MVHNCDSGVVHKHQFDRLAGLIEASRSQPYQEQERLRRELQTLMTKASRDRVPLPQADALMQDLKSAQVSPCCPALHLHLGDTMVHSDGLPFANWQFPVTMCLFAKNFASLSSYAMQMFTDNVGCLVDSLLSSQFLSLCIVSAYMPVKALGVAIMCM